VYECVIFFGGWLFFDCLDDFDEFLCVYVDLVGYLFCVFVVEV